jgi:arabinofuranan 3-O-arabinosyltransferase
VAAFALALAQRPGWASSDTKIDLHVAPARFLADVASVWTPSGSLGHVQGGQYGGYLFPMGPFFALGHALGLSAWLVDRLWLGAVLALAAWGTVRLLDALLQGRHGDRRGMAQVAAGAIVLLNPYVVVLSNRESVTLLAYAALPWLLLAVHRGVRTPRRWWWPAAFALILASSGGGVNAAVTAWMLLGPLMLLAYEPLVAGVPWADVRRFAGRAALTTLAASLWWITPVAVQALYGIDFLKFTEQPGTIWGTTSVTESLRLMGYWLSYVDLGFFGRPVPFFDDSGTLLFAPAVVLATLLVPALAIAGFQWTRRWRYGPFFLLLGLVGLLVMVAGFPDGTPLRQGLTFGYYHFNPTQFLRTPYKAAPLLALAIAGLGGAAAAELWRRAPRVSWPPARRLARPALALAGAGLIALSAWPMVRGRAIDRHVVWKRIPAAWTHAAHDLDRTLPPSTRAIVLPGALFSFYRWGGTIDPILPALSRRPVAVRQIVPYDDLHATDLLWTVDALVQQQRAYPGQLKPLLGLLGAGAVVSGSDDDIARSGALHPLEAARVLAAQGLSRPDRRYGPLRLFGPPAGGIDAPVLLPEVRRYDLRPARPIVRIEPAGPATVVDGSADALAGLAAFGALPTRRPLLYAGDRSAAQVRAAAAAGADVVISDSNRRRVFVAGRLTQNTGPTLAAGEHIPRDAAVLDPFADRGAAAQTIAVYQGASYVRAPQSPGFSLFPEHRPFAAFDGSPSTAWLADRALAPGRRWVEIGLDQPRDVDHVDLLPHDDARSVVTAVDVNGARFAVHPGWNRLRLNLRHVSSVRIAITGTRASQTPAGGGGLAEVRIPGVSVREALRPPVLAERALHGADVSRANLTYLLARTTGDTPFRRAAITGPAGAQLIANRGDGEVGLTRVVDPPAARRWTTDAWVSVAPDAPDSQLDRLTGLRSPDRFDSSSRFEDQPRFRASGAFDGGRRAWIGDYVLGQPAWVGWRTPRPLTVRRLRLVPARLHVRSPTVVRLRWAGGASAPLTVGGGGTVALPRPVSARAFRLEVLKAAYPSGTTAAQRKRRAVAIGEVQVPGLAPVHVPVGGALRGGCSAARVRIGRANAELRVSGSVQDLDAGRPLRASGCGAPVQLPAGRQELESVPGVFRLDLLRLRSPAPAGVPRAWGGGQVIDPGHGVRDRYDGVHLRTERAGWLVLGESFNRGWEAWCDGQALGAPTVVDGYANGWALRRTCHRARFAFTPGKPATWARWLSALAALLLVGLLVARRPTTSQRAAGDGVELPSVRPRPWPALGAALAGLAAGAVLGFVFGAATGLPIAVVVGLVLWRGVSPGTLVGVAAALLVVVVPLLYLVRLPADGPGQRFSYAVDELAAHRVGAAAIVLLAVALWRTLAAAPTALGAPLEREPPGADAPEPLSAQAASSRAAG